MQSINSKFFVIVFFALSINLFFWQLKGAENKYNKKQKIEKKELCDCNNQIKEQFFKACLEGNMNEARLILTLHANQAHSLVN